MSWLTTLLNNIRNGRNHYEQDGQYFYADVKRVDNFTEYTTAAQKLEAILKNPAALYLFILLPELFSMGRYKLTDGNGEEIEKDPLLNLLNNPNPLQTGAQFKYDYMFWRKLGTANLYVDSKIPTDRNKLYWLSPDCLEFSDWFKNHKDVLILSRSKEEELKRAKVTYKTRNQTLPFKYEQLIQFFDLSNGFNSWFTGASRVDALYKIIANSDKTLRAKNISAEFMGKYMVAGKAAADNIHVAPMGESDKSSIRESMRSFEAVYPVKSMVDVKRFVDDAAILGKLDESFRNDAFMIGKALNIPRDVIELLDGSTYENQEKARAAIVSYCLQPDADDFGQGLTRYFGYDQKGYSLTLDFSHLPFNQVFEKERAERYKTLGEALVKLVDAGADQQEAADLLGLNITMKNPRNEGRRQENSAEA